MLCLLCPDAVAPDTGSGGDSPLPAAHLLRRARIINRHTDSGKVPAQTPAESWLASAFGLSPGVNAGAFAACAQGRIPPPDALVVRPAYLHPTMDHLILQDPTTISITESEATQLIDAINTFWQQDGISLQLFEPGCWLLRGLADWTFSFHGSAVATGRNIDAYMPDGPQGRKVRALLNELQMLWHEHPVNSARMQANQEPINTIWIEGHVGQSTCPFQFVGSQTPATRGLARAAGLSQTQVGHAGTPRAVSVPTLIELSAPNELTAWLSASANQCRVVLSDARTWTELALSPADRFKFWRRLKWTP